MAHFESQLTTRAGLKLFTQNWQPEGAPRAVVVLTHGRGEHSWRYEHVGQCLSAAGYALYTYDLRGHGFSEGSRGHTPDYTALLDDLALVLDSTQQAHPAAPMFLYGHSMGGQITLNYALRRKPVVAGVLVTSPWLRLAFKVPAWKWGLARLLKDVWPTFAPPTPLDTAALSHDLAFLQSMRYQELCHGYTTARMGYEVVAAGEAALAQAGAFTLPLLMLCGTADSIVDVAAARLFFEQAGSTDKTLQCYTGMYHEVHNEIRREVVLQKMVDWLNAHC